jgi:hypothetical protein
LGGDEAAAAVAANDIGATVHGAATPKGPSEHENQDMNQNTSARVLRTHGPRSWFHTEVV